NVNSSLLRVTLDLNLRNIVFSFPSVNTSSKISFLDLLGSTCYSINVCNSILVGVCVCVCVCTQLSLSVCACVCLCIRCALSVCVCVCSSLALSYTLPCARPTTEDQQVTGVTYHSYVC